MGKQGENITREQTQRIIELYEQGCKMEEIIRKTGFSDAEIRKVIENYVNGRYDAETIDRGNSVIVKDGEIDILKPLIRYNKNPNK
jgi:DNA invertase Pin-like site-specific DNA recombinase